MDEEGEEDAQDVEDGEEDSEQISMQINFNWSFDERVRNKLGLSAAPTPPGTSHAPHLSEHRDRPSKITSPTSVFRFPRRDLSICLFRLLLLAPTLRVSAPTAASVPLP
ncbi:MAG: hypothetical protein BYD32DRAFT_203034 [Podila humilis]|nr:MAG: hypothetical protein BYD32DRAFT_203034 [Podila humilis]